MIGAALIFNRYTAVAALVAASAWGAYTYRESLIQQGYDTAMTEVQEAQVQADREFTREHTRQETLIREFQDAYLDQAADLVAFRERERVAGQRLRDQKRDFEARVAAASAESLRRYAQISDDNLDRCIGNVERFASEAAGCSGSAHALKNNLDAITAPAPAGTP